MADNKTTYLENAILNHVLRNTAYSAPATVYLALLKSNPGEAGTVDEVTGGSYARQAITFNAPSNGTTTNSSGLLYTNMPEADITHVAVMSAPSGGNMLYYTALPGDGVHTNAGNELSFAEDTITVGEK